MQHQKIFLMPNGCNEYTTAGRGFAIGVSTQFLRKKPFYCHKIVIQRFCIANAASREAGESHHEARRLRAAVRYKPTSTTHPSNLPLSSRTFGREAHVNHFQTLAAGRGPFTQLYAGRQKHDTHQTGLETESQLSQSLETLDSRYFRLGVNRQGSGCFEPPEPCPKFV
jgi:hypothetical protein